MNTFFRPAMILCAIVFAYAAHGEGPQPSSLKDLRQEVELLENTDVTLELNCWLGLLPQLTDRAQAILECGGDSAIPYLYAALRDKNRYVAAHVLLTYLSREEFCVSDDTYNGLKVDFVGDAAHFEEQRAEIEAAWLTNQHPRDCLSQDTQRQIP